MVVIRGRKRRIVPRRKSPRYVMRSMSEMRRILRYLRAVGQSMDLPLFEDPGNDLVERRIVHGDVGERVAVEDRAEHLSDLAAIDAEIGDWAFAAGHFAELLEAVGSGLARELEADQLRL